MRRLTHLSVATLAVMPLAVDHSWPAACGIVIMGMAGSVIPDYLDLRSDARGILRHRGFSHSLLAGSLVVAVAWLVLGALSRIDDPDWVLDPSLVMPLTLAFGIGVATHLALDACTPRGIRPLLPFGGWRFWLLPSKLRVGTGGVIDLLLGRAAFAGAVAYLVFAHVQS